MTLAITKTVTGMLDSTSPRHPPSCSAICSVRLGTAVSGGPTWPVVVGGPRRFVDRHLGASSS